jgi:hypothetical protein
MAKIRIREAIRLAEGHATGILESTDDAAFWGEDFYFDYESGDDWKVLSRARQIIMNRIESKRRHSHD